MPYIIGIAIVIVVIMIYNGLVRARQQVKEAWSNIDTHLKRRYDLIPNLVETVKGCPSLTAALEVVRADDIIHTAAYEELASWEKKTGW